MKGAPASTGSDAGADRARDALASLLARRERFLAFLRRRVRTSADAEDILQQAWLRAAEKIGTLDSMERAEAWFFRIVRNALADHHALRARNEVRGDEALAEALPPLPSMGCACSLAQMAKLKPEYATLLQRVDIQEEDIEEVATDLGITPNNASVRLHRARRSLREDLQRVCGTSSMRACLDCACDERAEVTCG